MLRRTALAALLIVLVGCDSQSPVVETPLLPLDVGTAWVFEYERTFGPGGTTASDTPPDTLRVVGETTRDDVRWAELQGTTRILDSYLGGFYTEIDGEVWYSRDLSEMPPYRLFGLEPEYAVNNTSYDANVALARSGRTYAYTFDVQTVRGSFLPEPGEFPVTESSPVTLRTLERGIGFARYDQDLVFFANPDSLKVVAIDTYRRTAFLPVD